MLRIDSNLIWIIVNLLIFYFLIRKFLFKPVLNIIEKRKQMVTEQFEKADTVNAEALELKTQYEASLQGAKEEPKILRASDASHPAADRHCLIQIFFLVPI